MKSIAEMGAGELAALVATHLGKHAIDVVLSGGSCVSIYSRNRYVSSDLDFIDDRFTKRRTLKEVLLGIGFKERDRYFVHPEAKFLIEFPPGPLSVGAEPVKEVVTLTYDTGRLRIISPTDSVKDRLAAYYHWNDLQCLEQALMVAEDNEINLNEVERWSRNEGKLSEFREIRARFVKARTQRSD